MLVIGADILERLRSGELISAKMVFNRCGAVLLPVSVEHRDAKAEGISYQDNYNGNALAAMLTRSSIEVRYHAAFSDADVALIIRSLLTTSELAGFEGAKITYQGRVLAL